MLHTEEVPETPSVYDFLIETLEVLVEADFDHAAPLPPPCLSVPGPGKVEELAARYSNRQQLFNILDPGLIKNDRLGLQLAHVFGDDGGSNHKAGVVGVVERTAAGPQLASTVPRYARQSRRA